MHLSDFNLLRESATDSGTEYVFRRGSDSSIVFITVKICLSSIDAENRINKYFGEIAMKMHEGPYQNVAIGDRYWWLTPDSTLIVRDLLFKRENIFFIMSSGNFPSLIELGKGIDGDILKQATYVKFGN